MEKESSRSLGMMSLMALAGVCVCAIGFVACVGDSDPVVPGGPGPGDGDGGTGGDAPNSPNDGSTPRDGEVDKDANGACTPEMRFGSPVQVPGVSGPDHDDQMTLTPDELKIYFTSLRAGGPGTSPNHNIWAAERQTKTGGFSEPKPLTINSSVIEGDPMLSPDGKTFYFTSNRVSGNGYDIFSVAASMVNDPLAKPNPVTGVNTTADEMGGYAIDDGTLFLVRTGPAPDKKRKIYQATRNGPGFDTPAPVNELATAGHDQTPVLSPDGRVIYWSSDRSDPGAPAGGYDIFMATREPGKPFGNIRRVDELGTSTDEFPGWISPDGCNLYFTRYSEATKGDIYVASRRR